MPVTFPAHQGFVLGLKLARPERVDATALCIGAAAPDLAYASSTWLNQRGHTAIGVIVWGMPMAIVAATIVRRWAARGIFAHLPDLGPLRLRSYGVIAMRRPPLWSTAVSAFVGAASHVVIDSVTHANMWGAELLGWDTVRWQIEGYGVSPAGALQRVGHVAGSLVFLGFVLAIGRRGLLERWYGSDAVVAARSVRSSPVSRIVFWLVAVAPVLVAWEIAPSIRRSPLFFSVLVAFLSLLTAGALSGRLVRDVDRQGESSTRATMS